MLWVIQQRGVGEMRKYLGKAAFAALVLAVTVQPAQACWTNAAQDAAKIKHLNTMLMVTALRCRNTADNFLPDYNRFVARHNGLIGAQNAELKKHLSATYGASGAEGALDRMSIGYANSYGTGHKTMGCSQLRELAAKLSSGPLGVANMAAEADTVIIGQSWSGESCPTRMANRP